MAKYDANFNMDVLYSVARDMDNFVAEQDSALSDIESETHYFEMVANEALNTARARLEREREKLNQLKDQLDDAIWNLSHCQQTDEEGRTTGEYEYWSRVVHSLENAVAQQEAVVERVEQAFHEVQRLSADLSSKAIQLRSITHSYSSSASCYGAAAADAIKHCAAAMNGYWDKDF